MRGSFRQYRDPKPLILEEDSADECGTSSRAFVGSRSCNSVKSGSSRIVEEMGGPYKRKKYHAGDTHLKKGWRVKRRTKDLDQIDQDLAPQTVDKLLNQDVDYEQPGLAQFYCVHCAKHFIDGNAFNEHVRGKPHKRRMKALETEPYTIQESERAAGMGSYVQPKKRKMETLLPESVKNEESIDEIKKRAKLMAKPTESKKENEPECENCEL